MKGIEMEEKMLFSLVWFKRENMKERKQSGRKSLRAHKFLSFWFGRKTEERRRKHAPNIDYSFIPQSCYPSRFLKKGEKNCYPSQVGHDYLISFWAYTICASPRSTGRGWNPVNMFWFLFFFFMDQSVLFFLFMKPNRCIFFFNLCLGFFMRNNPCN